MKENNETVSSGRYEKVLTDGFVLVQINADAAGCWGTVIVDVRPEAGVGGSLRYLRASVSYDANVKFNSLTVPVRKGETFRAELEDSNPKRPPELTIRTI